MHLPSLPHGLVQTAPETIQLLRSLKEHHYYSHSNRGADCTGVLMLVWSQPLLGASSMWPVVSLPCSEGSWLPFWGWCANSIGAPLPHRLPGGGGKGREALTVTVIVPLPKCSLLLQVLSTAFKVGWLFASQGWLWKACLGCKKVNWTACPLIPPVIWPLQVRWASPSNIDFSLSLTIRVQISQH